MPDKELINTSIDEYLISLANSINHAQRYISQLRVTGQDGQPSVSYQLPRVDFELKLMFQLDRRHPPAGSTQRNVAKGEGGGFLEARPLNIDGSDSDSAAAASTIKGTFVAVPIHGGTPPPLVSISWKRISENPASIEINVLVKSELNKALKGVQVEFNLDKVVAARLTPAWRVFTSLAEISKSVLTGTRLTFGTQLTDENGKASNTLVIKDMVQELKVPVVIDVAGITRTLIFTPE